MFRQSRGLARELLGRLPVLSVCREDCQVSGCVCYHPAIVELLRDSKGLSEVAVGSVALARASLGIGDVRQVTDYISAVSPYSKVDSQRLSEGCEGSGIVPPQVVAVTAKLKHHPSLSGSSLGRLLPVLLRTVDASHDLRRLTARPVDRHLSVDPESRLVEVSIGARLLLHLETQGQLFIPPSRILEERVQG